MPVLRYVGGQPDGKCGTGVFFAGDLDRSAMGGDDGFGNGKAKPGVTGGTGFIGAIKALEHTWQIFCGYPMPSIGHGQDGHSVFHLKADVHLAAVAIVLDGIG